MKKIVALTLLAAGFAGASSSSTANSSQTSQVIIAVILGLLVGAVIALHFLFENKRRK